MEQQVKTIRIKEGKVLVSHMVEPQITGVYLYDKSICKLYNASFVKVENTKLIEDKTGINHNSDDGDYPVEGLGLTMEVFEMDSADGTESEKVATVKFTPAEKEEKPDLEITWDEWEQMSNHKAPEDAKNNVAWHGAWLQGDMTGFARCMVKHVKPLQEEIKSLRSSLFHSERFRKEDAFSAINEANELREQNKKLQQEITTLRARIAELEKRELQQKEQHKHTDTH